MKPWAHIGKSMVGVLSVPLFFFAISVPATAFATSLTDIASAINSSGTQTTVCSADPLDCSAFLNNPTPTTFANLNPATLSTILSSPTVSTLLPTLDSSILPSLSSNTLISTIGGLTPNVLQNFSSTAFSNLPNGTVSTMLSTLSGNTLTSLGGGTLLASFSSGNISSILSPLFSSTLSSLSPTLFSSLPTNTISSLLSGSNALQSNVITGLGGNLLGGLSSGSLTSVFDSLGTSGITSAFSGAAGTSLLSGVDSGVLNSAISGVTDGLSGPIGDALTGAIGDTLGGALGGAIGGGGLFVPVNDQQLNSAFSSYVSKFTTYASDMKTALTGAPDSLRNIIAGNDPGGVAKQKCTLGDAQDKAFAYTDGPWANAIASTTEAGLAPVPNTVPAGGGYVKVNTSGSLRCILQDIVGYQKISLFVQIQTMLKQYIADAQQQELKNKLLANINAANLNWGKQGNQVNNGGVLTTTSVYDQNPTQSAYNEDERTLATVVAKAAAAEGDVIGSLELNWPLDTATQIAINGRARTEDPSNSIVEQTRGTLTAADGPFPGATDGPAAFAAYMQDANTPGGLGAINTFASMLDNPQNTPIGEMAIVQSYLDEQTAQAKERRNTEALGSGFRPTKQCSGLPSDPYCDPALMIDVSPSAQNQETITGAVQSGDKQVADATTLDSTPSDAVQMESQDVNTNGLANFDETGLQSSKPSVNLLINELYDTIQYAYFDSTPDQKNWAQAALLSIYDEMNFDTSKPATQLPRNEQDLPS